MKTDTGAPSFAQPHHADAAMEVDVIQRWVLGSLLAVFLASPAAAGNCAVKPYNFTNSTPADAGQVNADFDNLQTCADNNLAHNGSNSDITSLSGLTTPLSTAQGGSGNTTGQPSGTAGGSLAGTFPNPSIAPSGVTPGAYTAANVTISSDGRVTAASNGSPGILHTSSFRANGASSFAVPAGTTSSTAFEFICVGPGGGGGSGSGGNGSGGGGGGSGAYADYVISGFTAGQTISITVGAIGGSGSINSASPGSNGNQATTFSYASNIFLSCGVGTGGSSGTSSTGTPIGGGAAGTVTGSASASGLTLLDIVVPNSAQAGSRGLYFGSSIAWGGAGGSNALGQGGHETFGINGSASTGESAAGFGAGGAGGATGGTSTQNIGGAGTGGTAIIRWEL